MQRSAMSPVFSALDSVRAFLAAPIDIQRSVHTACLPRVEVRPVAVRGSSWSHQRLRLTPVIDSGVAIGR